jgi:hypothetical protein
MELIDEIEESFSRLEKVYDAILLGDIMKRRNSNLYPEVRSGDK